MYRERKNSRNNSVPRLVVTALAFIGQTLWLVLLFMKLKNYSTVIALITDLFILALVMRIYVRNLNSSMKLLWIMAIMAVPILGAALYLLYGRRDSIGIVRRRNEEICSRFAKQKEQDPEVMKELEEADLGIANQFRYLSGCVHYPVYRNEDIRFYGDPAEGLKAQKEALESARKFIFMEYHAIEMGEAFQGMLDILIRKAKEGVEVRILYDDVGSIGFLNASFIREMESYGIRCRVFNRIIPIMNIFMQNRDHRKIMVIDNEISFTGGYNLANEYFGIDSPYGEWKDSAIRFTGKAVNTHTMLFLEMWNLIKRSENTYDEYFEQEETGTAHAEGYLQPYGESPLDDEHIAENVYLGMIKNAKKYVYFTTPYLVIGDEMLWELTLAAKRGVDVRIVTPGIPDKKLVYQVTRSYYNRLVKDGVKIYEFTPGFCHSKQCIADDEIAVVGTINLDYRSLYHHFENAVLMYRVPILQDIRRDFEQLFERSRDVSEQYRTGRSRMLRAGQVFLRLFAPLL